MTQDEHPTRLNALRSVVSAPLLITVVGALLAGYLIPRVAAKAEDHRKAREIQGSLVRDVGQAAGQVTLTGELLATREIRKEPQVVFDTALLQWESDKAAVAAQLDAYFPKAKLQQMPLPRAWEDFAQAAENLYFLGGTEVAAAVPSRCSRAKQLMAYLHVDRTDLQCPRASWMHCTNTPCRATATKQWGAACDQSRSWNALALCDEDSRKVTGEGYERGATFFVAYRAAVRQLLTHEDDLVRAIRATTPAGF